MVTIYKTDNIKINKEDKEIISADLRGLSTDTKPTEIDGKELANGSSFIEIDTQNIFFFDAENEQWKEA